ncbi:MAG TPA: hypothetical protein VKX46_13890 [Ktedonobacteraceae bacterium]|jgi:hypothetical protein|nr:hypothetical protein [Ktedonobacteraceae bacterium]
MTAIAILLLLFVGLGIGVRSYNVWTRLLLLLAVIIGLLLFYLT